MELHPTGEVTEYTATIAYELLKEGDDGRQKVDSVSLILRAEGNLQIFRSRFYSKFNWEWVRGFLRVSFNRCRSHRSQRSHEVQQEEARGHS